MNRRALFASFWVLTVACGEGTGTTSAVLGEDAGAAESPRGDLSRDPGNRPLSEAPPAIETHPACVLSADCPAGQHCDLGECIQDCNTERPCGPDAVCSPRARCLAPSEEDRDPPPSTRRAGTLTVTPSSVFLTERDDTLSITLKSDSAEAVRYRVALDAPHLSIHSPRGSFVGETTLRLDVDSGRLVGAETSGTVRIHTTLGDATVAAPVRIGITGGFEGTMTYDNDGSLPLGSAAIALTLREDGGKVAARIAPDRSLLFPAKPEDAATGRGLFRRSDGAQFTVTHRVPAALGGERNRFARPVTRTVAFRVAPDERGDLAGTFEERIHGLLTRPVTLQGTVRLRRRSVPSELEFEPAADATPEATAVQPLKLADVFPDWDESRCTSIVNPPTAAGESCAPRADGSLPGGCAGALHFWATAVDGKYYRLGAKLEQSVLEPLDRIVDSCARDVARRPDQVIDPVACTAVPHLACALSDVVASAAHDAAVSGVFASLFAHVLAPALLVAQEEIVQGVKESFTEGSRVQAERLGRARDLLGPPATWVLQAGVMEYLARILALGEPGGGAHVTALRTLGRLFFVQSTIDGELARLSVLDAKPPEERLARAQAGAVLTLLEAAAIAGVLDRWGGSAPPDLGVELTDVLSPADAGFRTLLQGGVVFGVPDGFVPMIHQKGDESSNFAQVLASGKASLAQFAADERAFTESNRAFESNDSAFDEQVTRVRTEFETAIGNLCGSKLDLERVDWTKCGAGGEGETGGLVLDVELAQSRLQAAEQRVTGMARKIAIEERRVHEVQAIRRSTIAFVGKNGDERVALAIREGAINTALKIIEIASEASAMNFGAPLGNSIIAGAIEAMRTQVEVDRVRLETAKEMRMRADDAAVEAKNGMAVIQAMYVDMAQLALEMRQDLIGLLQARQRAGEAIERARRLYSDRAKLLAHAGKSPLRDPSYRLLQEAFALKAIGSRAAAQRALYLSVRALEYELNQPFGAAGERSVFAVHSTAQAEALERCLERIATDAVLAKGQPQGYVTELSVRRVLGVVRERTDAVTGEVLTAGDQFRRLLLQNENLDGHGGVGVAFASSAHRGNGIWPVNVCDDKITSVSAQVVGDFTGDDEAQVEVELEGGGVLRRCDGDALVNWSTSGRAVTQAGINSYGTVAPNRSLKGLSVASSRFKLALPGGDVAPANADLNLRNIDDIVLRIEHEARPVSENQTPLSLECLGKIGTAP